MLYLGVMFLVLALVAAALGFGGVAGMSWQIGLILLGIFLVLAIMSFLFGGLRRPVV